MKSPINFEAYKNIEFKHGIFIYSSDTCDLCKMYKADLNLHYNELTAQVQPVELILKSEETELREMIPEFKVCPATSVYFDNELKWFKGGVLFELQIKELIQTIFSLERKKWEMHR